MISTRGRYALKVMIELSQGDTKGYISLKSIARNQNISEKYLESIVAMLARKNLVTGLRGKKGGYILTKKPEDYTVAEIIEATEGTLAPVACLESGADKCERADSCKTLPVWKNLEVIIRKYLESVTLADVVADNVPEESFFKI